MSGLDVQCVVFWTPREIYHPSLENRPEAPPAEQFQILAQRENQNKSPDNLGANANPLIDAFNVRGESPPKPPVNQDGQTHDD